jgi:transmembrane sensor
MNSAPFNRDHQRARREAAAWLSKQDRGLSATEQDEFLQWLADNPQHSAWFARHRDGWNRLDGLAAWQPADAEPNDDILAPPRRSRRWVFPSSLAAAASVALAFVVLWPTDEREPIADTPPPVADARPPVTGTPAPGGYERRTLDDGSIVELNRGASIDVSFGTGERRVSLRDGEALFTVTKDPLRPFIVRAGGIEVRAIGTAFNVRLAAAAVEVLVTEGKVDIVSSATAPRPLVTAGQRAIVPLTDGAAPQVARATEVDLARLRAWQPQLLDFSSVPLADVIAELNRRNRVQLVLADPASAAIPIGASIRSDNIDGFVNLVASAAGLRAERRGDYEIVLHANR